MTKVCVTEAVKLAQTNSTTLYRYMNSGKLSYTTNELGKREIDVSELTRVFQKLQPSIIKDSRDYQQETLVLQERIKGLETLLAAKEDIIGMQKQQLAILTDIRPARKLGFWPFK